MTISTRVAVAAVGVLALAAHPVAQNREHQQQAAELRILQEDQQRLSVAIAQLAEAVKALSSRLDSRLDEAAVATKKGFADQELSIRNMSSDLSAIRERTQETDTRIRSLRDEIDALRGTISNLSTGQAAPPPAPGIDTAAPVAGAAPAPVSAAPPVATGPAPSTAGLSPNRMLDSAKSDYFAGQFPLAISGFEALVRAFPRSEAAGEAQFYTGESYYALNKWREAIDAYGLVVQNYRNSPSVPDAYRKRGQAYAQSGQMDKAREAWEAVIKQFPESDAARLASQDLQRINRTSPPAKP
ncbi:MAG TPA: tetratricopeptide repeat protein [Vicinamibacterales bacterium]|jgi:tol-pal system protein YbgF|nr:tetratricopeptide repeat protein [Vicinamibacterales bacterium]